MRPFHSAAFALAAGVVLALCGCGSSDPDARFRQTGRPDRGRPQGDGKGLPVARQKIDLNSGPGKEAFDFLKSVGEGSAKAEKLSAPFLKLVGLPVELPADKSKGYSERRGRMAEARRRPQTSACPAGSPRPIWRCSGVPSRRPDRSGLYTCGW